MAWSTRPNGPNKPEKWYGQHPGSEEIDASVRCVNHYALYLVYNVIINKNKYSAIWYMLTVWLTIRYDMRCYFNVSSKADISQLNLPHGGLVITTTATT